MSHTASARIAPAQARVASRFDRASVSARPRLHLVETSSAPAISASEIKAARTARIDMLAILLALAAAALVRFNIVPGIGW